MKNEDRQGSAAREAIRLDAPTLPQAVEEEGQRVIHVDDLSSGEKIVVQVPSFQRSGWHPSHGDRIRGYLNDTPSENFIYIDESDLGPVFWDAVFEPSDIPNGAYAATYTRFNGVNDSASSLPTPVVIKGSTASDYPGPVFSGAVNGVLLYAKISEQNGTPIQAQYELKAGDRVRFHWQGFDETGQEVFRAAYATNPPLTVRAQDVANGYMADTIPLRCIQLLGDLGSGVAHYEVQRESAADDSPHSEALHVSLDTSVEISWADLDTLQLTCTLGAPNTSGYLPNLQPCNAGTVLGKAGLAVTVSVSRGGIIAEAGSGDPTTYKTQLDGHGLAHFHVSSKDQTLVTLAAYSETISGTPPTVNATFSPYADGGTSGIDGYAYTTHVPSDGETPCCIFFQVSSELNVQGVTAIVTILDEQSQASIVGADPDTPHRRTIRLYADGSGWAEIVDACAEKVNVSLAVTGQQGERIKFPQPVEFFSFSSES